MADVDAKLYTSVGAYDLRAAGGRPGPAVGTLLRSTGLDVYLLQGVGAEQMHTLARVHAGGWVHHDVKPANVLLADLDTPVLTDFGIARKVGEPSPAGSLGYVSPERLAGRASDQGAVPPRAWRSSEAWAAAPRRPRRA